MGIVTKQSILTTIILYLGAVIGYLNLLYLFPKFLSLEEIGTVRTIQDLALLFVPFAQFGLAFSYLKFYPQIQEKERNDGNFLGFMLVMGLVSSIAFWLFFQLFKSTLIVYFSNKANDIIQYFPHVISIIFVLVSYNILSSHSQSLLKTVPISFIKDVLFRIFIACTLTLYFLGVINFDQVVNAVVLSFAGMVVSIIIYLITTNRFKMGFDFSFLKIEFLKNLLIYSFYSLLGSGAMLFIGKIDSIMISGMLGLEENGIYTTVFFIAVIIEFPKRAINQISLPIVSGYFKSRQLSKVDELYKQTSNNQAVIGSYLLLIILGSLPYIFEFIPKGTEFKAGFYVVYFIGLGRLVDMTFGINGQILMMSKYYKFNIVLLVVLAFSTFYFNYLLIPAYGINGAAVGSFLAMVIFNLLRFWFVYWKLDLHPFSLNTLKILFLFISAYLLILILPEVSIPLWGILMNCVIISLYFFIGILFFKPSSEINSLIKKVKARLFK